MCEYLHLTMTTTKQCVTKLRLKKYTQCTNNHLVHTRLKRKHSSPLCSLLKKGTYNMLLRSRTVFVTGQKTHGLLKRKSQPNENTQNKVTILNYRSDKKEVRD